MFKKRHLLDIKSLSEDEIMHIIEIAKIMKKKVNNPYLRDDSLKHKSIATLFYENSTRTKMSFMLAGEYLGATMQDLNISTSSVNKGESLIDTGKTLDNMGIEAIIMRNSYSGAPHILSKNVNASIINAGDGSNEHPTQALLDTYTIIEQKGRLSGLKIAIIGDIANSRVARSGAICFSKLGANVVLCGPSTLISKRMELLGNIQVTTDILDAIKGADVVMGLRVQFERQNSPKFPNNSEYHKYFGIKKSILNLMKDDAIIMHPGPVNRGVEMSSSVIDNKNSFINEQVKNGVAIRMAIIKLLLDNR